MKDIIKTLVVGFGLATSVWANAAAPDFTAPIAAQLDPGAVNNAHTIDFFDHPLSGAVNFDPKNTLPVQDLLPFFGEVIAPKSCQAIAAYTETGIKSAVSAIETMLTALGIPIFQNIKNFDATAIYDKILGDCKALLPDDQAQFLSKNTMRYQTVIDIRNSAPGATDVVATGQTLDPYTELPILPSWGYAGALIGKQGSDVWNDGVVLAGYTPTFISTLIDMTHLSSSLLLYRLAPNAANKSVLQFSGYSTAFLDKPIQDKAGTLIHPCFMANPNTPNFPFQLKPYKDLVNSGCVGEVLPVAVVTPNLYGHTNDKLRDLVVVNRGPMGSFQDPNPKIGFLTLYRRTDTIPGPTSTFRDMWQFEKAIAGDGIPEPYGAAVLDTRTVVVSSNKKQGNRYFIYLYNATMAEPKALQVGCADATVAGCLDHQNFAPYGVYTADINHDSCQDILLTRASITVDPKTLLPNIQFPDYFDLYFQKRAEDGSCTMTFNTQNIKAIKQVVPHLDPVDPKGLAPEIGTLATADFNTDGRVDVMGGDFTMYPDKASKGRAHYVYFFENVGGLLKTMSPPRFKVNTQQHSEVGVIDIKADAHANLGVVIGEPIAFAPYTPPQIAPNVDNACATGKVEPASVCNCERDLDGDNYGELNLGKAPNTITKVTVTQCDGSKIEMPLDTTLTTLTDCNGQKVTKTGRKWLLEWASVKEPQFGQPTVCDNCADFLSADQCKAPELPGKPLCYNPSQTDADNDGFGDICDKAPGDNTQSKRIIIREDRMITLDDGPVIAYNDELKPTGGPGPMGNLSGGPTPNPDGEITILLKKPTAAKDTPPAPCTNGDLACICQQNPSLQACVCQKDPNAPGCTANGVPIPNNCCLDVCRGDLTAPFPALCDAIRPVNDEIRKLTGLCIDVLVPVEGAQYHLSCTTNGPAQNLGNGLGYVPISFIGQEPRNYFRSESRPSARDHVLKDWVLLNPPTPGSFSANVPLDVNLFPKSDLARSDLSATVPDISLSQAPGITQIDNVMQIETFVTGTNSNVAAPVGNAATIPGTVQVDIKGFSSPPPCMWARSDCPNPEAITFTPQTVLNAIRTQVATDQAAGVPITLDTINTALATVDFGSGFLLQKIGIPTGQESHMVVPFAYSPAGSSPEGGCGCTMTTPISLRNTITPLLMATAALGGMAFFRRRMAKKH